MRGAISPPPMSLHYQSVLDKVSSHGVSGSHDSLDETAAVATGFFDLANADVVRYSVVRAAEDDNELELTVAQDQRQHDSCGGIVWESAFCLAEFIQRNGGGSVLGKNVLELGAGAGLVGMVCKKLGAKKVVLSDHPNAIALLRKNVQRNFHSNQEPGTDTDTTDDISVLPLDWRDEQHLAAVLKNGPYDVVVATDVVFSTDLVAPLLKCAAAAATPHTGVVLVCLQERCADAFALFKLQSEVSCSEFRQVPTDELKFVDDACVLFELKGMMTGGPVSGITDLQKGDASSRTEKETGPTKRKKDSRDDDDPRDKGKNSKKEKR